MSSESLQRSLAKHPRENLTRRPTPLHELPSLSRDLGLEVWIKRDDLTDLALGGDKPRKLEYEIALARANGADTLVTCGSSQSNHARLTTAAARQLGLDCTVVLSRDQWTSIQGNLLTVHLMGADIVLVDVDDHWDLEAHALDVCARLLADGRRPHYIPVSGTTPTSCLGYVAGGIEMCRQAAEMGVEFDAVYLPFGTGGAFTASMLAFREEGIDASFLGISVNRELGSCEANVDRWWSSLIELLDVDPALGRGPYELFDQFVGAEYGDPTEACLDAIIRVAQREGILLDPVYSGKVFAGFFDHVADDRWAEGSKILLVHTGGVPALFAYHDVIEQHLRDRGLLSIDDQHR